MLFFFLPRFLFNSLIPYLLAGISSSRNLLLPQQPRLLGNPQICLPTLSKKALTLSPSTCTWEYFRARRGPFTPGKNSFVNIKITSTEINSWFVNFFNIQQYLKYLNKTCCKLFTYIWNWLTLTLIVDFCKMINI